MKNTNFSQPIISLQTLSILCLCLLLGACSKFVKEEPYLSSQETKMLESSNDSDLPNSNNSLKIPDINSSNESEPDISPPEMSFARKRSQDESVTITDDQGYPALMIHKKTDLWNLMTSNLGENWQITDQNADSCEVSLSFSDPDIAEINEAGFFKRIFTKKLTVADHSGDFKISCQKQKIIMKTASGNIPSAIAVDNLFGRFFDVVTKK